jgi:methoxymalonate biosynthesis acyl carrier protein
VSSAIDLTEQISELLRTSVSIEVSSPDLDLIENGLLDSLTFVEILLSVEEEFGIEIGVDGFEIDDFRTVRKIAAFVSRHASAAA